MKKGSSAFILIFVIVQTVNAETRTTFDLNTNSQIKPNRTARSIFSSLWGSTQPEVEPHVVKNHLGKSYPIWKVHKYNGIDLQPLPHILSSNTPHQQVPFSVPQLYPTPENFPVVPAAVLTNNLPPVTPAPDRTFLQRIVRPFFSSSQPVNLPQPLLKPLLSNVRPFLPSPEEFIPNIRLNQLVHAVNSTPIPFGVNKEYSTTLDLLSLAKEIGVTGNQLPTLEEAGDLLGTVTQEETVDAIKELIQTKDGLDLIRSYIKSNPKVDSNSVESRQFTIDVAPQKVPTFQEQPGFYQVKVPQQPLPQSWLSTSGIPSGLDRLNKDLTIARTVIPTAAPERGLFARLSQVRKLFSYNNPVIPIVQLSTTPAPKVVSIAEVEKPLLIKTVHEYPNRIEGIALPQLPVLHAPAIVGLNQLPDMPSMPNLLIPKYLPNKMNGKYMYAKYPENGFDPFPGFAFAHEASSDVLHQYRLPNNEPTNIYNLQDNNEIFGKIGNSNQLDQLTQRRSGFVPVRNADQFYAEGKLYTANPDMISFNTRKEGGRSLAEPKMTSLVYSEEKTTTPNTVTVSTVRETNAVNAEKVTDNSTNSG